MGKNRYPLQQITYKYLIYDKYSILNSGEMVFLINDADIAIYKIHLKRKKNENYIIQQRVFQQY